MCLAIPGKLVKIDGKKAIADFGGVRRNIDLSLLEKYRLGDYVLVHVGFAIQTVDEITARETYRLLAEVEKEFFKEASKS